MANKPSLCDELKRSGAPAAGDRQRGTTAEATVISGPGWPCYSERSAARTEQSFYPGPEKMLMLAILEDAVICFQKFFDARDIRQKTIFRDAKNWLWSDRVDWPFAYRNVCDVLGIDAVYLRRGLTRRQHKPRSAKMQRSRVMPRCPAPINQRSR
jgi:hypothetical protein